MAAQILNGKELSIKIKEDLRKKTEELKEKGKESCHLWC